ncbi:S1C family serine protease [Gemmatimonadota bacterium]
MSCYRRVEVPVAVASLILLIMVAVPVSLCAQGDPARVPLPLEALQSKGQQSAVRILAYSKIPIGDPDSRRGSTTETLEVINIGSGVRFGVSNRVLTARSVVLEADSIVVEIGWRKMPASLLGSDEFTQLALLSVNNLITSNEPPAPSGIPAQAGDIVLLVDPLQDRTILHQGEIRMVLPTDLILTTLPIYPGLSGAPLLNGNGDLVGIVVLSLISDMTASGKGDAVAIPVDVAAQVAAEIEEFGQVRWGWIGGSADENVQDRIVLQTVDEGSPAALAGLRPGDSVTHYGGQALDGPVHLRDLVLATVPGTVVSMKADRDSQEVEVEVIVGNRPVMAQRPTDTLLQPAPTFDMVVVARFHTIFEELNRLFSTPGFDPERSDVRSRILMIERQLSELKQVSLPDRPPPEILPR